jgi:hypothetical protein
MVLAERLAMVHEDGTALGRITTPHDRLRHNLKTPLTIVLARAQLLTRMVRRSTLPETEKHAMLTSLAAIEEAVHEMVPLIDGIDGESPDGQCAPEGSSDSH